MSDMPRNDIFSETTQQRQTTQGGGLDEITTKEK